jgi:hypothetical protein
MKLIIKVAYDIQKANTQLQAEVKKIQAEGLKLNVDLDTKSITKAFGQLEKLRAGFEKSDQKYWQGRFKEQVSGLTSSNDELKRMGDYYRQIETEQQKNINAARKFNEATSSKYWQGRFKEQVTSLTATNTELKKMGDYYRQLESSIISNKALGFGRSKLASDIVTFMNANKNLSDETITQLNSIKDATATADKTTLGNLTKQFGAVKSAAVAAGEATRTTSQEIMHNLGKVLTWSLLAGGVALALRSFKQAIQELKNIDTLLTEISKTSNMTTLQLKKLGQESFNTANKYGATVEGYLEGVKEMARAGFGEQATSMAEVSILAQTAGDMTAELANEYLLATDAAYKLGGNEKKLTEILDGQNQVTNRNAVSMEQLAEVTDSYKIIDSLAYRVIGM